VARKTPSLRIALPAAIAALVLALAPSAVAAKGGGHGGSTGTGGGTISLALINSTDGLAHYGQKVTFAVSTTATTQPWVTLECFQGSLVYKASNGIFATSLNQIFTLSSLAWRGGAADCTAYLENWDSYAKRGAIQRLASTSFHVEP